MKVVKFAFLWWIACNIYFNTPAFTSEISNVGFTTTAKLMRGKTFDLAI